MENLGPGVREIIDASNSPDRTINLKDVAVGDRLFVKVGDREKDLLDFTITKPARENPQNPGDSATGLLPGWKWSSRTPDGTVPILIAGSATLRERSGTYPFTMMTLAQITLGRNLVIWLDQPPGDDMTIFRTPIQEVTLWKVETQN